MSGVKHLNVTMEAVAAVMQTHLGGQGAASGPSCHHICYTRWSRAVRTHPPAPTPERWSTPPCSRQIVASPSTGSESGSQTGLRSARSAEAAFELWTRGDEAGRRGSRFDREASSYRGEKLRSMIFELIPLLLIMMKNNNNQLKKNKISKVHEELHQQKI